MRDAPGPAMLLDIVALTLLETAAATTPDALYRRRIATSLVETVARETRQGPEDDRAEVARLTTILGMEADLATLNRRLSDRLRDGTLTLAMRGVAAHLWATTLAKIAIDQPRYDTRSPRR